MHFMGDKHGGAVVIRFAISALVAVVIGGTAFADTPARRPASHPVN
jgi:hypothetical protein